MALLATGCGTASPRAGAGPSTPASATTAPATTASRPAGAIRSTRRVRKVGGVTITPVADYSGRVTISERDGLVAVAVGGPAALQLRFAEDGEVPQPAPGAGAIPIWGTVHVGSNAIQQPVVTYPRCRSTVLATCDIYEWNAETHRERVLTLASKPGRGDVEATEDLGNVLRVTSLTPRKPLDQEALLLGGADATGTVTLQERHRAVHRVLASGGHDVVMKDGKLGLLEFRPGGPCGSVTAVMLSEETRKTMFRHKTSCDQEEGGEPVGVGFASGQFMFGFTRTYEDASAFAHPIDVGSGRQRSVNLQTTAMDYAPITSDAGYVVDGGICDGRWEGPIPRGGCRVDRVTGLDLG